MPDLEPCSRCGKQVLISRYSWSQTKVICKACEELNIQPLPTEIPSQSFGNNGNEKISSRPDFTRPQFQAFTSFDPQRPQEEILVTWSSLLKISFGVLLTLMVIILGFINKSEKQSPTENMQSIRTNILHN